MKQKKAFTIVELLTVVAVIAILIGLLIPSMNMARDFARQAKQRVQMASLDQAILAFRNEHGDYPSSYLARTDPGLLSYGGAQQLAEAMFGLDLRGFNPDSLWDADLAAYSDETMFNRNPRYLELDSVDVVDVFNYYDGVTDVLVPYTYVICDVFGHKKINIGTETKKVGMPILYYKANPAGNGLNDRAREQDVSVYRYIDNYDIANLGGSEWTGYDFINFIKDPQVLVTELWPYRPDSYILISAGLDGEYGTDDDITNFGK